jgi:hypothetical protein
MVILSSSRRFFRNSRTQLCYYQAIRLFFNAVDRNWETAWKQSVTPWETKSFAPPLQELFVHSQDFRSFNPHYMQNISRKRALVPGCGSGYDVMLLHQLGFQEVQGIYISFKSSTNQSSYLVSLT